jgi:hypothetical protein
MTTVRAAVTDFSRALDVPERVQQHPYGTLAAALGVGYVLGGGLFTRLTGRLLRTGARVAVEVATLPLVEQAFTSLARALRREPPPAEP